MDILMKRLIDRYTALEAEALTNGDSDAHEVFMLAASRANDVHGMTDEQISVRLGQVFDKGINGAETEAERAAWVMADDVLHNEVNVLDGVR